MGAAHAAEVDARNDVRNYDQDQATLRNELQSQRASFITPLYNLTGIDPALYNNTDKLLLEMRELVKSVRENPKKYLTIRMKLF